MPKFIFDPEKQDYTIQSAYVPLEELIARQEVPEDAERRRISHEVRKWSHFLYESFDETEKKALNPDDDFRIGVVGRKLAELGVAPSNLPLIDDDEKADISERAKKRGDRVYIKLATLGIPEVITAENIPDQLTWKDVLTTHWANFFTESLEQTDLSTDEVDVLGDVGRELAERGVEPRHLALISPADKAELLKKAEKTGDKLQIELARLGIPEVSFEQNVIGQPSGSETLSVHYRSMTPEATMDNVLDRAEKQEVA
jgi:hypothetical protein